MTDVDYIETLIESEKSEHNPGKYSNHMRVDSFSTIDIYVQYHRYDMELDAWKNWGLMV